MNQLRKTLMTLFLGVSVVSGGILMFTTFSNQLQSLAQKDAQPTLDLSVSIVPQEYFVKKIGGNRVKVNVMVEPGAEPATYEPKPRQLSALNDAEAYISIGVPFEKAWMNKIKGANSQMLIIDSTKGINKMEMVAHHHHENHDHEDHYSEETLDPHVWLSPQLVKIQAENIYQGLSQLDSENQGQYKQNLDRFISEIDQLDRKIKQNLAGVKNRKFIVFHPAWGYFAREYNLEQIPVEIGGQEPSAYELVQLIKTAKEENIKVVFAQPEFSTKSAKTIAKEFDGKLIFITPLAPDWYNNLLKVSEHFADALK